MKKAVTCCLMVVFLSGYLFAEEVLCKNKNVSGCLLEIKNKPGCFIPNNIPEEKEEVIWSGACKNNRPTGKGTTTWFVNGIKKLETTGEMINGYIEGTGSCVFYENNIAVDFYEGEISRSRPNGKGVYKWTQTGDLYTGSMKDGKPHGYGVYKFSDGLIYKGPYVDGWEHGQGEMIKDGKTTKGCWEKGYFLGKKEPCGK